MPKKLTRNPKSPQRRKLKSAVESVTTGSKVKAKASVIKIGDVLDSFTVEGTPTKVRVVAMRKSDLDKYVI